MEYAQSPYIIYIIIIVSSQIPNINQMIDTFYRLKFSITVSIITVIIIGGILNGRKVSKLCYNHCKRT